MSWLELLALLAALLALFAVWDRIFCGGRRSRELTVRVFELSPWRFRRRPPTADRDAPP